MEPQKHESATKTIATDGTPKVELLALHDHGAPRPLAFLANGCEMGDRIVAHDWSKSALGGMDHWPQNLRTALGICLGSTIPMHVWWGPELTLFYNDASIGLFDRSRHPMLGRPGSEVWKNIWHLIGPAVGGVFQTGRPEHCEDVPMFFDRRSAADEVYATFSFSPIYDDRGHVNGLLSACVDSTQKVIGRRRLETLEKLDAACVNKQSIAEAIRGVSAALTENTADVPFAALYLLSGSRRRALRVALIGSLEGTSLPPASLALKEEYGGAPWNIEPIMAGVSEFHEVDLLPDGLQVIDGVRRLSPTRAAIVPLRETNGGVSGILILGLNPHRRLDAGYRTFTRLLAQRVSTALIIARANAEAQERTQAAAALDRAKTMFFAGMTEELRAPLTLVLGPVESVLADPNIATSTRRDLEIARRGASRLLKLVNSLLDFARIDADRMQARFQRTDLAVLTRELVSHFVPVFDRAGLMIDMDLPTLREEVYLDREMWAKIVLNLLSNAFKFTLDGGVTVRLREELHHAILEVADTGLGIPEEDLPRLFERFRRTEDAGGRSTEGAGIGLAMTQALVKLHGGGIAVQSRLRSGTTFTVRMPLGSVHLPLDQLLPSKPLSSSAAGAKVFVEEALGWLPAASQLNPLDPLLPATMEERAWSILVIHENADMRDYVRNQLQARYSVLIAHDGDEALALIGRTLPQLVLTERNLRLRNGSDLLKTLRSDPRTRELPIIMLATRTESDARTDGIDAGADDYLARPFSARELMEHVDRQIVLARKRQVEKACALEAALRLAERRAIEAETINAENATLRTQLAGDLAAMNQLHRLSARLLEAKTLQAVFEEMLDASIHLQGAHFGTLQVFDHDTHTLAIVAHRGLSDEFLEHFRCVQIADGSACGRALQTRERTVIGDVDFDTDFAPHAGVARRAGVRAVQSTPILSSDGELFGVLSTHFREPRLCSDHDLRMTDLYLQLASVVIEHRSDDDALREADRRKDEFLATLAHELRNPLAPIRNSLQLMRMRTIADPAINTARDMIDRQVTTLVRLVDDLLEVSRIKRGRIYLRDERIDLCAVIEVAVEASRAMIEANNHSLHLDLPGTALHVDGDATRLAQVFTNLLNNAAKYTRPGGRIDIFAAQQGMEVRVQIKDSGIGIPRHMLNRIFDLFTQIDTSLERAQGGLGIGLTLVRHLIELHGGRIVADSDGIGTGSTFTVYLPSVASISGEEHSTLETSNVESAGPRKVLIADDNADAANSLLTVLASSGHDVRAVYDAAEALRLAEEFQPDVILLDIGMPRMNGYEAARRLRALPGGRTFSLAALTGWGQERDRRRGREAGFDDHFTKPVDTKSLLAFIAKSPIRGLYFE